MCRFFSEITLVEVEGVGKQPGRKEFPFPPPPHPGKASSRSAGFGSRQVRFLRRSLTRKSELEAEVLAEVPPYVCLCFLLSFLFLFYFFTLSSVLSGIHRTLEGMGWECSPSNVCKSGPLISAFCFFFYLCPLERAFWVPADGSCFDVLLSFGYTDELNI